MTTTKQNAEVTLNALNAEVDVESLEPSGNFNQQGVLKNCT